MEERTRQKIEIPRRLRDAEVEKNAKKKQRKRKNSCDMPKIIKEMKCEKSEGGRARFGASPSRQITAYL